MDPLTQALLQRLEDEVKAKIMPRMPTQYPQFDRAVREIEKTYPADMVGVDVKPMDMMNPLAFSNVLGATDHKDNQITINPAVPMAFSDPQALTEQTIAHELQHVRQNKSGHPGRTFAEMTSLNDYFNEGAEKDARAASESYSAMKHQPTSFSLDPRVKLPDPLILEMLKREK